MSTINKNVLNISIKQYVMEINEGKICVECKKYFEDEMANSMRRRTFLLTSDYLGHSTNFEKGHVVWYIIRIEVIDRANHHIPPIYF